jgi:glucokinase
MRASLLLAADVGGTKTLLRLGRLDQGEFCVLREGRFISARYPQFEDLVREFLQGEALPIAAACFGVAGPVVDGICQTTNLPWRLEARTLAELLGGAKVELLNDLHAAAFGILHLPETQLVELNQAAEPHPHAHQAVIAAGTGLGEALILKFPEGEKIVATEGGHCDFAPLDAEQDLLLAWLRARYPEHVSYERVLSGSGLVEIYRFLSSRLPERKIEHPLTAQDPAAVIGQEGVSRRDELCYEALKWFSRIYGAEAANLVLKSLALGGVYVAGGIALKILPVLREGWFMAGFTAKGRFSKLLEKVSVKVVLNPEVVLLGAQAWVLRQFRHAHRCS